MTTQAKRALVVTLSGDRPIGEVARDLRNAGLEIDQLLDAIGVVTGSARPEQLSTLRGVAGVADVSFDQPVDIGPPDNDVS